MTARDVPAVAALEAETFSTPWSEAAIRGELTNPLALWLVAREDGALAGYAGAQAVLDGADIMSIAVAPALRRRGIAAALLRGLEERLLPRGVKTLTLEVRPSNQAALALYGGLGFQVVGRRPRYYEKPREDAVLMTLFYETEAEPC